MTSHTDAVASSTEIDLATAATVPPDEALQRLGSSDSGLSGAEAADRLKHYGPNVVGLHRVRAVAVLWGQLRNPLLLLLLVAAAVSGLTGDSTHPDRQSRPRNTGPARRLGHQVRAALHVRLRPAQLDL